MAFHQGNPLREQIRLTFKRGSPEPLNRPILRPYLRPRMAQKLIRTRRISIVSQHLFNLPCFCFVEYCIFRAPVRCGGTSSSLSNSANFFNSLSNSVPLTPMKSRQRHQKFVMCDVNFDLRIASFPTREEMLQKTSAKGDDD